MPGQKPKKQFRMGLVVASVFDQPTDNGTIFNVSMKKIINWKTQSIIGVMSGFGIGNSVLRSTMCVGARLRHSIKWL